MHLCFSCISYLSFGTEIARETKPQPSYILTKNNALDRFIGYIVFPGRGHHKIVEVMVLIKNTGESFRFIESKYIQESLINLSFQLYISFLDKRSHFITFHFIYYDQSTL